MPPPLPSMRWQRFHFSFLFNFFLLQGNIFNKSLQKDFVSVRCHRHDNFQRLNIASMLISLCVAGRQQASNHTLNTHSQTNQALVTSVTYKSRHAPPDMIHTEPVRHVYPRSASLMMSWSIMPTDRKETKAIGQWGPQHEQASAQCDTFHFNHANGN